MELSGYAWHGLKGGSHPFYAIDRLSSSEQQKRLDQQWSSLTFQPPASQQPSWRTSELFHAERNAYSNSPSSSKGQLFQGESLSGLASSGSKVFSPLQMNHEELKHNANDISLSNVPLPSNPDLFSRPNDTVETFNLKRVDQGPVEALRTARPHLASPNEFLSHSRGQDTGLSNGKILFLHLAVVLITNDNDDTKTALKKFVI